MMLLSRVLATPPSSFKYSGRVFMISVYSVNAAFVLGKKDFVFKTSANYDVKENSNVKVIVDLNKIHLFDTIDKNILV